MKGLFIIESTKYGQHIDRVNKFLESVRNPVVVYSYSHCKYNDRLYIIHFTYEADEEYEVKNYFKQDGCSLEEILNKHIKLDSSKNIQWEELADLIYNTIGSWATNKTISKARKWLEEKGAVYSTNVRKDDYTDEGFLGCKIVYED